MIRFVVTAQHISGTQIGVGVIAENVLDALCKSSKSFKWIVTPATKSLQIIKLDSWESDSEQNG